MPTAKPNIPGGRERYAILSAGRLRSEMFVEGIGKVFYLYGICLLVD